MNTFFLLLVLVGTWSVLLCWTHYGLSVLTEVKSVVAFIGLWCDVEPNHALCVMPVPIVIERLPLTILGYYVRCGPTGAIIDPCVNISMNAEISTSQTKNEGEPGAECKRLV